MGKQNKARRKRERQARKQKEDDEKCLQQLQQPQQTTDSLNAEATSGSNRTETFEDVALAIQAEDDAPINTSFSASNDTESATPTIKSLPLLTMPSVLWRSFSHIGMVVQAVDNNIKVLLVAALAESIFSGPLDVTVLEGIIRDNATEERQNNVAADLEALTAFIRGDLCNQDILLNVFKKALSRFSFQCECREFSRCVVCKISQPSDDAMLTDRDNQSVREFLGYSADAKGLVVRLWTEKILFNSELTIGQLNVQLRGRRTYVNSSRGVVQECWSLFFVVKLLVQIRNNVVHRHFKFINNEQTMFFIDYKYFIGKMDLLKYFPLRDHTRERERYLQLEVTSKDIERILEFCNDMVKVLATNEERLWLSEQANAELKLLVKTREGTIMELRQHVADLIRENNQHDRVNN